MYNYDYVILFNIVKYYKYNIKEYVYNIYN